ncbi:MAG: A/G-specific adenine glycosylase [Vampirovibrionales bacterium]|nr:A/G-specific adenine glycosylase [Vampirovibrionales bacterium]
MRAATDKSGFALALTRWYASHARDLPWRRTRDPYHVWLSEIMLQQTQVATVIPYYERFLARFSTVEALAAASEDETLKLWEGLGYYARGRNLRRAAQAIVETHQGRFPDTLAGMMALPGVGRSTAGAILTFAMGQAHPLLDGNVKRVLSRLFCFEADVNAPRSQETLWDYSAQLLAPSDDPYAFNQAVMELGATLCTPQAPQCLLCPVKDFCEAAAKGAQHELPRKAVKKPSPHYDIGAAVLWNGDRVLIQQRPRDGLLGGLWEFPGGKREGDETLAETVAREIREELALEIRVRDKLISVKHAYTHFRITLHAFDCDYLGGEPQARCAEAWRWTAPEKLRQFAFPKANNRVIDAILARRQDASTLPGQTTPPHDAPSPALR